MKRNLLLIFIFICSLTGLTHAQSLVFHETFETVDSMTSSGTPAWVQDTTYFSEGTHSIRGTIGVNSTSYLTSDAFSTTGNFFVLLRFDQICKINFVDQGSVEVSHDNGSTWTTLTGSSYLGASPYFAAFNYFSSFSYGATGWNAANDAALPQSSWWRSEVFDISSVAANSAQVKIRFKLMDANGNGASGNYGWLIDNVSVDAALNELVPPVITWSPPVLQGTTYYLGPYTVADTVRDASGVDSVTLYYSVNGGAPVAVTMTNTTGNVWQGMIPAVNDSDTVCYYVQAKDVWNNTAILPVSGCNSFIASSGITFPYIDNFDVNTTLWTPSSLGGSNWQLGMPSFGVTNSTHSGPNAWDIDLTSGYQSNTNAVLTSPVFNFVGIYNAKLSFWRNHKCEAGWDGTRLEYTTNGTTWQILGIFNDPLATNWYTANHINSSNTAAWDGQSAGWTLSTYRLLALNNTSGPVQFRFIFTSDNALEQDGFSIDDFSIAPPPVQDVGVVSILQPGFSSPASVNDTVKVVISNFGSQPASNFNVSYTINAGVPVSQLYSATLQPGTNDTVTFTAPFQVPTGAYTLCTYTSLAGDGDHTNDTGCTGSHGIPLITLPYIDNFDTLPSIWYQSSLAGTAWELGTPNFGSTNSTHSGSNAWDINLTSAYGANAHSVLTSPLFDFTGIVNAKLSFWMNRNISTGDGAYLEYSVNGGTTWQRLGIVNDPNAVGSWYNNININLTGLPGWDGTSSGWVKYTYILGPPFNNAGTNVQFRFIFTSNGFNSGDGISIDDISIAPASPDDLGVTFITRPAFSSPAGSNDSVQITIRNYGTSTIISTGVAYMINGTLAASETWNGSLAPSASTSYTFSATFSVPSGSYDICAYTSLGSDGDHSNDTACKTSHGIPTFTLPYIDDFDTGPAVWLDSSAGAGTNWQQGTPAFGQTTGAHSPNTCWDINLNSAYQNNAKSYLTSPLFDFTGFTNVSLSFWQNRNTENTWDGTRLEYSTDGGSTWAVLGTHNDPSGINWYNKASIHSTNLPAWDSISTTANGTPGWQQSTYLHLPNNVTGQQVRFRFVFFSDNAITKDGVSIDNFELYQQIVDVPTTGNQAGIYNLYPNPSSGIFYLEKDERMQNNFRITVTDVLGNEIPDASETKSALITIDLSSKPNGIYFVNFISNSDSSKQKIVLCR